MSTEDSVELVGLLGALYARAMPGSVRLSWCGPVSFSSQVFCVGNGHIERDQTQSYASE